MSKKELKPKIRFKGCEGELIENPIGNIGSISMCKRVFKYQTSDKGEVPFYKIGTFGGVPDAFISRKLYEELKNKYKYPKEGAILISASGTIGKTVEYCGKDEYFQDSNIIWIDHNEEIIDKYIKYYIQIVNWYGLEGSTIKRLYNNNILKSIIKYPKDIKEQTNIGEFFDKIDKSIKQSEEKVEKWKNIRTSLLSKMFPKEGKKVPELRFKGFSGEWEKKKLKDIVEYRSSNLSIKDSQKDGLYDLYDANGIIGKTSKICIEKDYITIIKDGAGVGRVRVLNKETMFIGTMGALVPSNIDIYFLYALLIKSNLGNSFTGSTIPHIYFKDYGNNEYMIPTIEEQNRIGMIFKIFDELIYKENNRIEKLEILKNTFLNKMFV